MPDQFVEGIDVSSNQGIVNWDSVSGGNVMFVFARAAIGGHQTDSQFPANWSGIRNAGLIRGAYHFFWPLTSWQDQADNFISTVGALQAGDLPPALDLEEAFLKNDPQRDLWGNVPADQRLPMIQNWLNRVEQGVGMRPIIYTRQNFIENLLGDGTQELADFPLWIAHYDVPTPKLPAKWVSWTFWQYTDKGQPLGLNGNTDCNKFNGSLQNLTALTKTD